MFQDSSRAERSKPDNQFLVDEAYERCGLLAVLVPLAPKIEGGDLLRKRHERAVRAAWWAEAVHTAVAERVTHVFTSDPASSGPLANLLGADVLVIDEVRARFPLQGRLRRPDLLRNFGAVAPGARRALGVTVGIVGAESCGKSTMARELGTFFDCPVLDDPLRAIASERPDGRPLSIDYDIAAGSTDILVDTACREGSRAVVVSDATAMMARVWSERFIDPRGTVVEISGSGQDRINAAIDAVEAARDQAIAPWARLPGPASR